MNLVNGAVSDCISPVDRGLAYGDGVFRTLVLRSGRPRWWSRHFRKLERDCAALGIACPGEPILLEEVTRIAQVEPDCVIKIIVTRGPGPRGYAQPASVAPTRIVLSSPLLRYPAAATEPGVAVRLCSLRLGFQPALAGVKHLNRLENVLARAEWDDAGIAEGLLLDLDGNVIGGTMSNLILIEDGVLITPELTRCGVAGVTREAVLEAAAAAGMPVRIEHVGLARVLGASELLLVNSVIGVWQVRALGDRIWAPGTFVHQVRQWLDDLC